AEQVDLLKQDYGIYLVRSGRMCTAGLNLNNIDYVADSMATVLKAASSAESVLA
ncbi:aromatic amino acid aminotransferase, partial [Acinetobacter baumannii]|nr:aromatic amino acid aminotransferase [Acinetobacter baumannii]